ncbi:MULTISPECIES: DNA polymerase III subunit alpha [unclassified Pseudonocardia]|uniref:DNA polymerase III subunit alpha n=1 Tax=unclassified Pseudonocardia TaxID=2619320 RepID=UPI0001FFED61|nr:MULTISPECIES: DNA polymerase III subunit alpha [unclassified Pseudonocardia]ALE74069.1 DNA polymerase III subunit alpha [Pseudonocardia sp. EC080625-04]ALL77479.1 DNA polymerase III subunit alpha [Pseudonocardia sp. EC080610-09]ALL80395.1 DNA polymerase III subunit alpha [Pseudonocardia sp. EC080619-01]OLM17825.1 DNA polymerase III alpha subunit [Pseudonocardia sp. Ae707_Ps1]
MASSGAGSFVHLHTHTEFSMLDGAARLDDLFSEAVKNDMSAVAMTDHGNVYGAFEFWRKAKAAGVKPIIGMEGYLAPGSRHERKRVALGGSNPGAADKNPDLMYTHMTLLAENTEGMHNLFRLSSLASLEGYYYKPRMDRELLEQYGTGLIGTTGCPSGEVARLLQQDDFEGACQAASDYRDIFGKDNFFCELMDHGIEIEKRVQEDLFALKKRLDLPGLATNDLHYTYPDDTKAHEVLLCVQTGKTLADPNRFKFDAQDFYLKSATEMRELWDPIHPEACDNTLWVAERCDIDFTTGQDLQPKAPVPEGETEESWLIKEVERGLHDRFPNGITEQYRTQANYEVGVIIKMGYPGYFLVTADLIRHAKSVGIRCGPGRGSAAGSLVAYVLGITDLDPIRHKLIFERFLNPDRVSMPDIDMDFDERRRGEMIRYVTEKYGEDRIAQIITYSTIKAKAAIKDSARVLFGQPGYSVADRISKAMPPAVMGKDIPLSGIFDPSHKRYSEATEVRALYEADPQVKEIVDTARGLEGLKRQWGVHAAGVIMSSTPLIDVIPIQRRESDGAVITQFDMGVCETIGLLKMDFLGLRNLTILDDALENITLNGKPEVDLDHVELDDGPTYELLSRGDTLGVFQLDGGPMRDLLRRMAPSEFEHISAVGALYRPGPMGANAHNDYADRKNGRQEITPIHPELAEPLKDVLGETFGLIVYQEQVMSIAQVLAGYSLGQADLLRRAMGKKKKEILDKEYVGFAQGMKDNGYSADAVKTLWDILLPFSDYAFNRAHSAAYGVVSYWTAYLKANYPAEYMAGVLTSVRDDKDKAAVYLAECRRMGVTVLPPDVNDSVRNFAPVGNDIRFGLGGIRNVGHNVVDAIVAARREKGNFVDFSDFLRKVDAVVCNKKVVESLIKAGAFDSLGHSRKGLLLVHADAIDAVMSTKKAASLGQFDLFGSMDGSGGDDGDELGGIFDVKVPEEEWDSKHKLAVEREMLGLYVSGHPLQGLEQALAAKADTSIADIVEGSVAEGGQVTVGGILANVNRRVNKNGEPWASAQIEDLAGGIEVLFFPRAYQVVGVDVAEDAIVLVKARVNKRDDRISLIANDLAVPELAAAGEGGLPIRVSLRTDQCTPERVSKLKEVLTHHPGTSEVHLSLVYGSKITALRLDDSLKVMHTSALMGDLKALLGPGCLGG